MRINSRTRSCAAFPTAVPSSRLAVAEASHIDDQQDCRRRFCDDCAPNGAALDVAVILAPCWIWVARSNDLIADHRCSVCQTESRLANADGVAACGEVVDSARLDHHIRGICRGRGDFDGDVTAAVDSRLLAPLGNRRLRRLHVSGNDALRFVHVFRPGGHGR